MGNVHGCDVKCGEIIGMNFSTIKNYEDLTLKQMFDVTAQLVNNQEEIHGLICRDESRQAQESKAVHHERRWEPQLVPYMQHKRHTDTVYELDLFQAPKMVLTIYHLIQIGESKKIPVHRVTG